MSAAAGSWSAWSARLRAVMERLSPGLWTDPQRARQRQFMVLGLLAATMVGVLWLVFSLAGGGAKPLAARGANPANPTGAGDPASVTNIGVMAPGEPLSPEDQWVGNAGRKLAQYESDKQDQERINRDTKDFEASTMKRFGDLEQRLTANALAQANGQAGTPANPASNPQGAAPGAGGGPNAGIQPATANPSGAPPEPGLPPPPRTSKPAPRPSTPSMSGALSGMPPGLPPGSLSAGDFGGAPVVVPMVRVSLVSPSQQASTADAQPSSGLSAGTGNRVQGPSGSLSAGAGLKGSLDSFLPVSFTSGFLLGGLDAPTGGQAQSNPHPVIIRLSDTSVLPNQMRADYRECFVIASGYGDISSERAYMRTALLSCVRKDHQALEVEIEGNVFGEDGKYGVRGKLVSKQGQMLANALLAGVVSGIGQGFATANTTTSTSALGSIATTSGSQAYRAGIGNGVGRALDRLAQYYIKLAEQTFPIIEVDAGREVDVVITKGVRIDSLAGQTAMSDQMPDPMADPSSGSGRLADYYFKVQDEDY